MTRLGCSIFLDMDFSITDKTNLVAADTKDITEDNITTVTVAVDSIIQKFEESGAAFRV